MHCLDRLDGDGMVWVWMQSMRVHASAGLNQSLIQEEYGVDWVGTSVQCVACRAAACVVVSMHALYVRAVDSMRQAQTERSFSIGDAITYPRHRPWLRDCHHCSPRAGTWASGGRSTPVGRTLEQGQDCSLYDKPTRLLFTGIRNWRICRCYSAPQWVHARLAARMAASFPLFPPTQGHAPQ